MFKRSRVKSRTYDDERQRILTTMSLTDPAAGEYAWLIAQLDRLDEINKRSSEKFKTVIPACITTASLIGIYALQQFAGVVVPKALEAIASRQNKELKEKD